VQLKQGTCQEHDEGLLRQLVNYYIHVVNHNHRNKIKFNKVQIKLNKDLTCKSENKPALNAL